MLRAKILFKLIIIWALLASLVVFLPSESWAPDVEGTSITVTVQFLCVTLDPDMAIIGPLPGGLIAPGSMTCATVPVSALATNCGNGAEDFNLSVGVTAPAAWPPVTGTPGLDAYRLRAVMLDPLSAAPTCDDAGFPPVIPPVPGSVIPPGPAFGEFASAVAPAGTKDTYFKFDAPLGVTTIPGGLPQTVPVTITATVP